MSYESSSLTSTCPGFIQQYFLKSRLHHISTWKSNLINFVNQLKQTDVGNGNNSISMRSKADERCRTIMHIDMDCFFASVALRDRPHLIGKPIAVAHSHSSESRSESINSSSEIASCNYIARSYGVKNGMFLGSALALCSELVVLPYEFDKYDSCSKSLYRVIINHSNYVQAVSCDEVVFHQFIKL